jgi:chromosome segregation ATPase
VNTELAEMRQRQDSFGMRLTTLEEQVEAEASMRAAMAQDVSFIKNEQRAQRGMLQAVGQTLSDHSALFFKFERQLTGIDDRLTSLEGRVVGMDDRLGSLEGRVVGMDDRLGSVEGRLTSVEGRLGNVETRLGGVETRLDRVEQGLGTVQIGVQTIIAMLDRQIDEQSEAAGN